MRTIGGLLRTLTDCPSPTWTFCLTDTQASAKHMLCSLGQNKRGVTLPEGHL
uniref:Uncharacterized protein n=1 Tax=Anguilla anguilla TaxID=7936 RepID=A0A0E9UU15_ANGAN